MKADVYFTDMRMSIKANIFSKLENIFKRAKLHKMINKNELVALKLHFGEEGNTGYIHPKYIQFIARYICSLAAKPFLTDTNTIYVGSRSNSVDHIKTATGNGFSYSVIDAPIIIADGLRGRSVYEIDVSLKHFQQLYIGSEIAAADKIVCLSHFKGHEVSGFGGAIKNIGMGCATRAGKLAMHSTVSPYIVEKTCTGCKTCVSYCPADAIYIKNKKAHINGNKCIGCGQCLGVCLEGAIKIKWDESTINIQEKMCEYAYGVIEGLKKPVFFVNFLMNISPACDCYGHTDASIVPDIGILASYDLVAVDQASVDLVNKAQGITGTALSSHLSPGEDKFRALYPQIDWEVQLRYAENLGLGTRTYELITI